MELESSFFHSSDRRHWLIKLSDFQHHSLKNEFDAKLICQKLIGIDGNFRFDNLQFVHFTKAFLC